MNHFRRMLKRKVLRKTVEVNAVVESFIQPYKEMPSVNFPENKNDDRLNAHELFSHYTVNVIREEIVYAR